MEHVPNHTTDVEVAAKKWAQERIASGEATVSFKIQTSVLDGMEAYVNSAPDGMLGIDHFKEIAQATNPPMSEEELTSLFARAESLFPKLQKKN